jgi:hypothetical protein
VVDREEEEEVKEMISLWKKQGVAGEGRGVILTRHGTMKRLCPTHYSNGATELRIRLSFGRKTIQNHAFHFNCAGR